MPDTPEQNHTPFDDAVLAAAMRAALGVLLAALPPEGPPGPEKAQTGPLEKLHLQSGISDLIRHLGMLGERFPRMLLFLEQLEATANLPEPQRAQVREHLHACREVFDALMAILGRMRVSLALTAE